MPYRKERFGVYSQLEYSNNLMCLRSCTARRKAEQRRGADKREIVGASD
jgi:hypothetical protein